MRTTYYILLILVVQVAGCIVHFEDYPSDWSPINESLNKDCGLIAGKYKNHGIGKDGNPAYLASWFLKEKDIKPKTYEYVTIAFGPNNVIDIAAGINDHDVLISLVTINEYKCSNSGVSFNDTWSARDPGVEMLGNEKITIFWTNGYLVVNSGGVAVGVMYVIPVGAAGNFWYRFEALTDTP